jgi:hypothetical protein
MPFYIAHYEVLQIDPATWRLDVLGYIGTPLRLSQRSESPPRQEVTFTLESSGNNGFRSSRADRQRAMGRRFAFRNPEGGTDLGWSSGSRILRR